MSTRIGELLVKAGKLDPSQLERALRVQRDTGERLGTLLVQLGFVAERDLAATVAQELGVALAQPDDYRTPPDCIDQLSMEFLKRNHLMPIAESPEAVQARTEPSAANP